MGDKSSCTCPECVKACRYSPGWMTPQEAEKAMGDGLGKKLMVDWWVHWPRTHARKGDLLLLCPASRGSEGDFHRDWYGDEWDPMDFFAPRRGKGTCTFLTKEGRCSIHDSGFKPIECRETIVCDEEENTEATSHEDVAALWATDEAQALVTRWIMEMGREDALREEKEA